ncbi:nuclear envelope integral membrane protein [Pseudonocardia kujensis]|uniref:nuclear envelope integral membrane protein n=1 Tax=Pseudonocardia kujensis TaxID=1128675 RepID=UPI001E358FA0|nr:nuclear envelope integral membrane protein [Pseudonocardia kujensis]MCE0765744.1 nuclear envelope integral membrane protein [Pseudonocardia kujensis]
MSSTMSPPAPAPAGATRITTFLFALSVVFFLLAGLAIVVGQVVTLAAGDATAARQWASAVAPYAFGGASVSGLLSFALSYRNGPDGHGEPEDAEDD